ncbi:MAG: alpha-rhamnosidase, partial [Prevotella sp.]|nr:alpha-rhamnosidase [Prevotella sp.]
MVKTRIFIILLSLVSLTITSANKKKTLQINITDLRTERLVNPMSIDTSTPRLGWRIETNTNDVKQTCYHLIVSSTPEKAQALDGDLWESIVDTDQSQWISYQGKPLRSNTRCYWRVKVSTNKGDSDWSDVAMWNVGLLYEADWQGRWIGLDRKMSWDEETEHSRLSARYLRKEFEL